MLNDLKSRLFALVTRGKILNSENSGSVQTSLLESEVKSEVPRVEEYGFQSRPLDGAEQVTISLCGNRDHSIVIKVDDKRYKLASLKKGEVAIYTDEGDHIHFKRGNKLEVKTKTLDIVSDTEVKITTPKATINAENTTVNATSVNVNSDTANINSPTTTFSGLIQCAGIGVGTPPSTGKISTPTVPALGELTEEIRDKYNQHVHNSPDPTPDQQVN